MSLCVASNIIVFCECVLVCIVYIFYMYVIWFLMLKGGVVEFRHLYSLLKFRGILASQLRHFGNVDGVKDK